MTLLDTNTIIHCLKGREPASSRFRSAKRSEIAIPSVVAYELEYGTLRITNPERRRILSRMLDGLQDIPFDRTAAKEAAAVRIDLEQRGFIIGLMDLLIAGTALGCGGTLATNNTREFSRIENLRLEDWTLP